MISTEYSPEAMNEASKQIPKIPKHQQQKYPKNCFFYDNE